jgi:cellulose biosynthesis protein BcsQ
MPVQTPVISFASPKGGAGKTTAALVLASELLQQLKKPVTIIDADPNRGEDTKRNLKHVWCLFSLVKAKKTFNVGDRSLPEQHALFPRRIDA